MKSDKRDYKKLFIETNIDFLRQILFLKSLDQQDFLTFKKVFNNLKDADFKDFHIFSLDEVQKMMSISLLNKDFTLLLFLYNNFEPYFDSSLLLTNTKGEKYIDCSIDEAFEQECLQTLGFPEDIILDFVIQVKGLSEDMFDYDMVDYAVDFNSEKIFIEKLKSLSNDFSRIYDIQDNFLMKNLFDDLGKVIQSFYKEENIRYDFLRTFIKHFIFKFNNKDLRKIVLKKSQNILLEIFRENKSFLYYAMTNKEINTILDFLTLERNESELHILIPDLLFINWSNIVAYPNNIVNLFDKLMKIDNRFISIKPILINKVCEDLKNYELGLTDKNHKWYKIYGKNTLNDFKQNSINSINTAYESPEYMQVIDFLEK